MMKGCRSRRLLLLVILALVATKTVAKKGDDRNWNKNNSNKPWSSSNDKKGDNNDKKKKKNKDKDDSNQQQTQFQTSFNFFPQPDILQHPERFWGQSKSNNNNNNNLNSVMDTTEQAKIDQRLEAHIRRALQDGDMLDEYAARTRQDWEDYMMKNNLKFFKAIATMVSKIVTSQHFQSFVQNRERQEQMRMLILTIKGLLDSSSTEDILMKQDRWQSLFDQFKKWENKSQYELLKDMLDFVERHEKDMDD